jgi:hypothetical protein
MPETLPSTSKWTPRQREIDELTRRLAELQRAEQQAPKQRKQRGGVRKIQRNRGEGPLLWGAKAIGAFLGRSESQIFYGFKHGQFAPDAVWKASAKTLVGHKEKLLAPKPESD